MKSKQKAVAVTFGRAPAAFDWLQTRPVALPESRKRVYRAELEDRAALLYRLRYSPDQARARLRANVRWDFEVGKGTSPISDAEIDSIVEIIYKRGDSHSGSPSV